MTTSAINAQGVAILTGDELIAKTNELNEVGATKAAMCYACGYVRQDGNPNFTEFYTKLMEAKGVTLSKGVSTENKDEDTTTYVVSVPVYVNVIVDAKPGMTDEEVIAFAKDDSTAEVQDEDMCDFIDDVLAGLVKPVAPIEVRTLN